MRQVSNMNSGTPRDETTKLTRSSVSISNWSKKRLVEGASMKFQLSIRTTTGAAAGPACGPMPTVAR